MAFYGDTGHQGYWTTSSSYDFVPNPVAYGDFSYSTPPQDNYSFNPYESSAPKFLQYEPLPSDRGYFTSETKFYISYSTTSEFNEPEFEEYDPTPYDGGYDIAATYGKPLPPSDLICYPRSVPQSVPLDNFSYGSPTTPSPHGKEDAVPKIPPTDDTTKTDLETAESVDATESENENGYGYGYGREMVQIPYGSGLESMDLCDSLFGYWPCLAKREREERAKYLEDCEQYKRMDPWNGAADYLFGSSVGYSSENYHQWQQEA